MHIKDLSIKARIIAALAVLALLLAGIGAMGILDLKSSNQALLDMHANKLVPAIAIARELDLLGSERALLERVVGSHDSARVNAAEASINDDGKVFSGLVSTVHGAEFSSRELAMNNRLDGDAGHFQAGIKDTMRDLSDGKYPQATDSLDNAVDPAYASLRHDVTSLFDLQQQIARKSFEADEAHSRRSAEIAYLAMIMGLLLSGTIGFNLIRSISRSLREAMRVADNISNGQLNNRIEITSNDEVGRLLHSLSRMDVKLAEVVSTVLTGSTSVSTAAKQIALGNDDLSQRTQEQASSLEETASSMEEMTATVRQNAENASQANQLVRGARQQAEHGGEVVANAVAAMNEINDSSRKISDIVGLMDEIAFQTNLLSLNAAVEAARAGEHGRGFAVVASEVRVLAQRSAVAAKEIKSLIGESVERVQVGSALVDQSGQTLREIVESVKRVTDIVAEIAAASNEQSSGIDQVNNAVMQMDEVTQRNAALVEEAASASRSMQEQADELRHKVSYFRLSANDKSQDTSADERSARELLRHAEKKALGNRHAKPEALAVGSISGADWKEF